MRKGAVFFTFALAIVFSAILSSCASGPSQQERKEARATEQRRISLKQADLEAEVERRISEGEVMPERVPNPSYPIAKCTSPVPPEGAVTFETGFYLASFVCQNTAGGRKVFEWRAWYCKGKNQEFECVLGFWENGIPNFSGSLLKRSTINNSVIFDPPDWQYSE